MHWTGQLARALQRLAREDPARILIDAPEEGGAAVSREELWRRTVVTRDRLAAAGLPPGSVLLWMGGNAAGFYSLLVAAIECRIVLLLADQTTPREAVADVESRWGVAGRAVRAAGSPCACCLDLPGDLRVHRVQTTQPRRFPGTAAIKLTSGSVGAPRGVPVSEAHLCDDVTRIVEAMGIREDDVHLASIPITHSYGLGNLVLPSLAFGCRTVLRSPRRPHTFWEDVTTNGVTVFPATPHIFDHLLERSPGELPSSLRLLVSAGAPLRQATVSRALDAWGLKVHSFYGTSETGGIAFDASDNTQEDGCVGRPLPRTTVALRPHPGAPPASGRVFVRSASVSAGYVPAAGPGEAGTFVDDGFLTGDLGEFGADGALRVGGRVMDVINVGGLKVDPREVEAVLRAAPGVSGAVVVGVPCASHGEDVVAVVTADQGVLGQAVEQFCRTRLSRHQVPRSVLVVDRLPVTRRGKVDRAEILRRLAVHPCAT